MKQLIPILILLIGLSSYAQRDGRMNERIKAQKVAFITEKLSLTAEEAQQFWPIYNAFEEKRERIKSGPLRDAKIKIRSNPNMSDNEASRLLEQVLDAENEIHNAKIKLAKDLQSILSSKKIIKLRAAEDEFNRILLERLKQMRQKRANRN
ncbi:sensor of ECF-type sigma factor [Winogradskyella alexanderae]|uniref:Sensor of ECF-type sigma factor n=1 Tax=Winogradskyella alexanderae TaxID=2877123 RepID=A0ABS7XQB7_9FLAO|nr:sensor of ECF-type sigma factor [Winogradskyella alexanderae]MCA0132208.1 sensor of ECF-type sigma factor [Winogradskyella alexanderae]